MGRSRFTLAALFGVLIALLLPVGARAAAITVNTNADESGAGAMCSLREALEAANTDGVFGGCSAADEGTDTLVLQTGATYGRTVPEPLPIENENVVITGNGATVQGTDLEADGAVFDIFDVNATMSNLTIRDGFAFTGNNGGGIDIGNGAGPGTPTLNLSNSTITSNTALSGGGIASFDVDVNLTNVTISGNASLNPAAGLDFDGGDSELRNVTVTENVAPGQGGGLYVSQNTVGGTHTMLNSIIAGNTASSSPDCFEGVGVDLISAGRVLIGNQSGCSYMVGTGDLTGAAGLGPLANNGGLTPTHGLQPGSQAIDAGNPATPTGSGFTCEPVDQRGVARPVGAFCDMGAFEGTLPLPPFPAPNVQPPPNPPSSALNPLCSSLRGKLKKAESKRKRKKIRRQLRKLGC